MTETRYRNDVDFHTLVDMMEAMIHNARFTPSEMREAATLASTHFELHTKQYPAYITTSEGLTELVQTEVVI